MAEIFLARKEGPEGFARDLVVKRILPHLAADPEFSSMFLEEARIAARLTHPNVVHVYDFGEVDGTYYLAMEFIRGVDLRALIVRAAEQTYADGRTGGIPPHHAAKILSFVCEGLAHAHTLRTDEGAKGIVHRDVTPSNVLISFDGAVKVADFGIAKAEHTRKREATRHGVVKGKFAYMSPEQARGDRLDARSDIFNAGILLFEAVVGMPLFPQDDARAAKSMSARGTIPQPERLAQLPPALAAVARRALSPEVEDRYPDALSMRADLEAFLRAWSQPSDTVEIGRYVQTMFPDAVEEDSHSPRAAGTVTKTVAGRATQPLTPGGSPAVSPPRAIGTRVEDDPDADAESLPTRRLPAVAAASLSTPLVAEALATGAERRASRPPGVGSRRGEAPTLAHGALGGTVMAPPDSEGRSSVRMWISEPSSSRCSRPAASRPGRCSTGGRPMGLPTRPPWARRARRWPTAPARSVSRASPPASPCRLMGETPASRLACSGSRRPIPIVWPSHGAARKWRPKKWRSCPASRGRSPCRHRRRAPRTFRWSPRRRARRSGSGTASSARRRRASRSSRAATMWRFGSTATRPRNRPSSSTIGTRPRR